MQDYNGIRDPRKTMAPEPEIWRQDSFRFMTGQIWGLRRCLDVKNWRRFSFISPVERLKERPEAKSINARGRWILN